MRLHFILLVAAATIVSSTNVVSAIADSAETKLSTMTAADFAPAALPENDSKRFLRSALKDEVEDENDLEDDEERNRSLDSVVNFLQIKGAITAAEALELKVSGIKPNVLIELYRRHFQR